MKSEKHKTITSYIDKDILLETIVIPYEESYFIIFNRKTKEVTKKNEINIKGTLYKPININSSFIKSESILFPSEVNDYGSIESIIIEIQKYIYKYTDVPDDYKVLCSYYVLLSYIYNIFSEIPYLRVIGDYGSGKSRFLKTIGSICYIPMFTNGGTSLSAVFRIIENFKGTLILDEADFTFSDKTSDMIKLLNNGYQKGNPIMRADGEKFDVSCYNVFCPKIIGGRGKFKDEATESRCLSNIMKRTNRIDIPIGLDKDFFNNGLELRNKLLKFRFDYYNNIELKNNVINGLESRLNQIINPILSIVNNKSISNIIINYIRNKQKEVKNNRKDTIFGSILLILKNCNDNEVYFKSILSRLKYIDGISTITSRKLGSLFKENSIETTRKNDGTIIDRYINKVELERVYKEYSIIK